MLIPLSAQAIAQAEKIRATVFPIEGLPFVIEKFSIDNELFYEAELKGKQVKLPFEDLKEIRLLAPGKSYEAEVTFNNGEKEIFLLQPASNINIISQQSYVSMSHNKISRISFSHTPVPVDERPSSNKKTDLQNTTIDRVILKNGDGLSGLVQVKAFHLTTRYGKILIEAPQIAYIEFDAKEPDKAVVILRDGDRLSGMIARKSILFMHVNGEGLNIDSGKIRMIYFKR